MVVADHQAVYVELLSHAYKLLVQPAMGGMLENPFECVHLFITDFKVLNSGAFFDC